MPKQRLDQLIVERGLAESRAKAQAMVMAGIVKVAGKKIDKPGHSIPEDAEIEIEGQACPWVSRGGLKLAKALEYFSIDPKNAVALDVGASTGGFTDVLLTHGAKKVYAVDVGQGQLAWKLQQDARVVVLDKTNARYLVREQVPEPIDWIVCDASFISLKTILPAPMGLAAPGAKLVALIKPQFEAGRDQVGKGGVVKDPDVHQRICDEIRDWMNAQEGWQVQGITESPITGPSGNREFLLYAMRSI